MATTHIAAHISASPLNPSFCPHPSSSNSTLKIKTLPPVRCALSSPKWVESGSRRFVSFSLLLSHIFIVPNNAIAANLLDKYVKKKRLDPLEAYVPAVILTLLQIKDLEKTLEVEEPRFASCRSLLRSGPAASLRINIRACCYLVGLASESIVEKHLPHSHFDLLYGSLCVHEFLPVLRTFYWELQVAQYASDAGSGDAFNDVDQCLRALEELDSLLLRASRNDPGAPVKSMKAKIDVVLDALQSLLQTVPPDILDKGKAIADAYRNPEEEEEAAPQVLDPELKELESIL